MDWALTVQEAQNQLEANSRRADTRRGAQRNVNVCACLSPRHKSRSLSVVAVGTDELADFWIESGKIWFSRNVCGETELSQRARAGL